MQLVARTSISKSRLEFLFDGVFAIATWIVAQRSGAMDAELSDEMYRRSTRRLLRAVLPATALVAFYLLRTLAR